MTDHTTMSEVSRVEVIQTGARRRWTLDEKRRIVAESESGPRQISVTARRYGLTPGRLFGWRRLAREGRFDAAEPVGFARAVIAREAATPVLASGLNRIEVVLADGEAEAAAQLAAAKAASANVTVRAFERRKRARRSLPEHLLRERIVYPDPSSCPCWAAGRCARLARM